jgi:hypothetical protein
MGRQRALSVVVQELQFKKSKGETIMKNNLLALCLALGSALSFATALKAQTYQMIANVPFAFHIRDSKVEPGKYRLARASSNQVSMLSSATTGRTIAAILGSNDIGKPGQPRLVFNCYGNECFLSEAWTASGEGTSFGRSREERAAREKLTADQRPRSEVIYARN